MDAIVVYNESREKTGSKQPWVCDIEGSAYRKRAEVEGWSTNEVRRLEGNFPRKKPSHSLEITTVTFRRSAPSKLVGLRAWNGNRS